MKRVIVYSICNLICTMKGGSRGIAAGVTWSKKILENRNYPVGVQSEVLQRSACVNSLIGILSLVNTERVSDLTVISDQGIPE